MWGPREKTPFARRTKQTQNTLILPTLSSGILASRRKDTFLLFNPVVVAQAKCCRGFLPTKQTLKLRLRMFTVFKNVIKTKNRDQEEGCPYP